jgi:tryptophan synthase beta chain
MDALAYNQQEVFEAAMLFAQTEGFIVAPESAHAVRAAIDFAKICKKKNEKKIIVFTNSGHGHFDLAAYDAFLNHKIVNGVYKKLLVKAA